MPKSKRNRLVSLTRTKKVGKDAKNAHIDSIRSALEEYDHVFVVRYDNMRSTKIREVRKDFRESKLYLGKNTISKVALGKNLEEEVKDNLHNLCTHLEGNSGLLFTSRNKKDVIKYFKKLTYPEYAKAGEIATSNIILKEGKPLEVMSSSSSRTFDSSMLDQFRKLGVVVEIDNGIIIVKNDYVVASKGKPLNAEQAKLLTHLEVPMSNFKLKLACHWSDGEYEEL